MTYQSENSSCTTFNPHSGSCSQGAENDAQTDKKSGETDATGNPRSSEPNIVNFSSNKRELVSLISAHSHAGRSIIFCPTRLHTSSLVNQQQHGLNKLL